MNYPKISIIVPVYNVEEYLPYSIECILVQTFKDFELLLINDGSSDNSGKICIEYALKDARIRVFSKENEGVSSARNLGLDNANGEWVLFVDADDGLKPFYLERLMNYDSYDLVIGGHKEFGDYNEDRFIVQENMVNLKITSTEILDFNQTYHSQNVIFYYSWGKMFRAEIIRKNNLRFDLKMRLAEDSCFIIDFLRYSERIILVPHNDYMYRKIYTKKKYIMSFEEYIVHKDLFANSLINLETVCQCKLPQTFQLINERFFYCFLDYIKSITSFRDYALEIKKFRNYKDKSIIQYIENDVGLIKKLYVYIILNFPYLGFYLLKLKKSFNDN